jgi:hypothetical protein
MPYIGVETLFSTLVHNTHPSSDTHADASGKQHLVRGLLNRVYYGSESTTANSFPIGSYGKDTLVGPRTDIDLLFELPDDLYRHSSDGSGNVQSLLLEQVRNALLECFPSASIGADGEVVVVPFAKHAIRVLPGFRLLSGKYRHPDANGGGRWRTSDPIAERQQLVRSNALTGGKTTHLIRMAKAWRKVKKVEIESFVLELLAIRFLESWGYNLDRNADPTGYRVYDFMVRDFFPYLLFHTDAEIGIPGTSDVISAGNAWEDHALAAAMVARDATRLGAEDRIDEAKGEWRKIFRWYLY